MNSKPPVDSAVVQIVNQILADFSSIEDPVNSAEGLVGISIKPKMSEIAQQQIIRYLLVDLLGYHDHGRFEKVAWEVTFEYSGGLYWIKYGKFGLTLGANVPDNLSDDEKLASLVIVRDLLRKAARVVERRSFQPFIEEQVRAGRLTISNRYHSLKGMYQYFRERVDDAYQGRGRMNTGTRLMEHQTEAFFNIVAMVSSYFSWLEHRFVLALAFSGYQSGRDDVVEFIRLGWREKYKRVFPLEAGRTIAEDFYERLQRASEEYRNTYVHGGFDKGNGGLLVHCAGGALVADLFYADTKPSYGLVPIEELDFRQVCELFDEFDEWLEPTPGEKWASAGLDVAFSPDIIASYEAAMTDPQTFDTYIEEHSNLADMYANMDW
jgi:hypothetical protein